MSRGTECTVPIMPGLVIVHVVPAKSSGEILPPRTFAISASYACQKLGEVERVGLLHARHEQRVRAVAPLHVDREPEVHVLVAHDDRLAVLVGERRVEAGEVGERAEHRVRDEVGEAHLARAGARELVVEDLAVDLEQLGGDGAHRRRGRARRGSPPCSRRCARPRRAAAPARRRRARIGPGRASRLAGACCRRDEQRAVAATAVGQRVRAEARRRRCDAAVGGRGAGEVGAPVRRRPRRGRRDSAGRAPRPGRSWIRGPRSGSRPHGRAWEPEVLGRVASGRRLSGAAARRSGTRGRATGGR